MNATYLTRATTLDGSVGGYTEWRNPLAPSQNATSADLLAHAKNVIVVLYAGQYAERVLAEHDLGIHVPDSDPNWANDEQEAAKLLAMPPLSQQPGTEAELRVETLDAVRRNWHIIDRVASRLIPARRNDGASHVSPTAESEVLRDPDIRALLRPVDPEIHRDFEMDHAVVQHEVGHLVTWFLLGGGIGPMRFERQGDHRLLGAVRFGPRNLDAKETPDFIDAVAERLLAGEIAARRHLGKCDWQISLGDPTTVLLTPTHSASFARARCHADLLDARNLLSLAEQHHADSWWPWMEDRIRSVRRRLELHWPAVGKLAARIAPYVPDHGERSLSGTDLIRWCYDAGLAPIDAKQRPVELVPKDAPGDTCTQVRRWWRSWGHQSIHTLEF